MQLKPTGKRAVTLREPETVAQAGEQLATKTAKYSDRWNVVTLYRCGEEYTAAVEFRTVRKGETDRLDLYQGSLAEVTRQLESHDPLPPGYGWPPIDRYASENAHLRKILGEQWSTILHAVIPPREAALDDVADIVRGLALPSAAVQLAAVPIGTLLHWIKIGRVKSYPMFADDRVLVNVEEVRREAQRGEAKRGPKPRPVDPDA